MGKAVQTLAFTGPPGRAHLLRGFYTWLDGIKRSRALSSGCVDDPEHLIRGGQWQVFLDDRLAAQLRFGHLWQPEEIVEGILRGQFQLEGLQIGQDGSGELRYRPVGEIPDGESALRALLKLYGYEVVREGR